MLRNLDMYKGFLVLLRLEAQPLYILIPWAQLQRYITSRFCTVLFCYQSADRLLKRLATNPSLEHKVVLIWFTLYRVPAAL